MYVFQFNHWLPCGHCYVVMFVFFLLLKITFYLNPGCSTGLPNRATLVCKARAVRQTHSSSQNKPNVALWDIYI